MTEYDNNLRGALFKNEDKGGVETRADYRGSCEIARVQYWVDAWIKTSKGGKKYMSLTFKPKQASEAKGGTANPPAKTAEPDFDDKIPF